MVKAEIINDPVKGGGYGIIRVDFEQENRPGPGEPVTLAIQQFPSKYYLQPPALGRPVTEERWMQGGPRHQHTPLDQQWEGQALCLFVGPDIVDALTAKLHALTLSTPSSSWPQEGNLPLQKKNLKISGLVIVIQEEPPRIPVAAIIPEPGPDEAIPPDQEDLSLIADSPEPAVDIIMPEPTVITSPPSPQPGPVQHDPPQYGAGPGGSEPAADLPNFAANQPEAGPEIPRLAPVRPSAKPGPKAPVKPAPKPAKPGPESSGATSPKKKKFGCLTFLIIALTVGLLLAGGGAAFWFLYLKKELAPYLEDGIAQTENGQTTPKPPPIQGGGGPADPAKALNAVQELLRREAPQADLEQAYQRYEGLAGAEDAVFLLAESLASSEPAMRMRYAAFFDPTDTKPCGSILKDAVIAYKEYQKVRGSAYAEAENHMKNLREWAEQQAPLGNWEAKKLKEYLNQI